MLPGQRPSICDLLPNTPSPVIPHAHAARAEQSGASGHSSLCTPSLALSFRPTEFRVTQTHTPVGPQTAPFRSILPAREERGWGGRGGTEGNREKRCRGMAARRDAGPMPKGPRGPRGSSLSLSLPPSLPPSPPPPLSLARSLALSVCPSLSLCLSSLSLSLSLSVTLSHLPTHPTCRSQSEWVNWLGRPGASTVTITSPHRRGSGPSGKPPGRPAYARPYGRASQRRPSGGLVRPGLLRGTRRRSPQARAGPGRSGSSNPVRPSPGE